MQHIPLNSQNASPSFMSIPPHHDQAMTPLISMIIEAADQVTVVDPGSDTSSLECMHEHASDARECSGDTAGSLVTGPAFPNGNIVSSSGSPNVKGIIGTGGTTASYSGSSTTAKVASPASRSAINGAANWEWCTVAVYACGAACGGGAPSSGRDIKMQAEFTEEFVYVIAEADCEMQS